MSLSDRQLLDALSRMPFVESTELALVLGEPHATVHRVLANLRADGIVGRLSHCTRRFLTRLVYGTDQLANHKYRHAI